MTASLDRALSNLGYDPTARTVSLSAAASGLPDVRAALATAFGEVDALVLSEVTLCEPPEGLSEGWEALCLVGRGRVFNYTRVVYLELGLFKGEVDTLLLVIPLPATAWKLSTGFNGLSRIDTLGTLQLRDAYAVITYALGGVEGTRTIGDRTLTFTGYDLQDGLQLLSAGLVDASGAVVRSLWDDATSTGMPPAMLPDRSRDPDRVEVRADISADWLKVEVWWDNQVAPVDLTDGGLHAAGVGIAYTLGATPSHRCTWLWEVGGLTTPVVLEAIVWPGAPLRYTTRLGAPAPLGETVSALSALIGGEHLDLLPEAPDSLTLIGMTYAPGQEFGLEVAAGDRSAGGQHLITVGPIELREVRYSVRGGMGRGDRRVKVRVEARAAFFGVDFGVNYTPGELIEGGLADPGGVALGAFLEEALGVPLPFGLDTLTLREAWVRRILGGQARTELSVRVDGRVALLPGGDVSLDELRFKLDRPDEGGATVSFGATFTLGPLVMRVDATHSPAGWTFSGMGNFPDGLSLTGLVDSIVSAFGASVPDSVPDVKLETVALDFDMASRSLSLQAVLPFTVDDDVPVLAGEHTVMLALSVSRPPGGSSTDATFSLDWSMEKGAHQLAASVFLSRPSQVFSVQLDAPGVPITLSGVLDELGVHGLGELPGHDVLDAVFTLSRFSLSYSRPPTALEIAWARPLGDGTLLSEFNHSADADKVKVTWLAHPLPDDPATLGTLGPRMVLDACGLGGALSALEHTLEVVKLDHALTEVLDLFEVQELGLSLSRDASKDEVVFLARSAHDFLDRSFLMVNKAPGAPMALVAGVSFQDDTRLSRLPFLPSAVGDLLESIEGVLLFQPRYFILSTQATGRFRPPGFPAGALTPTYQQSGVAPASTPFGGGAMPLGKGVAVGMRLSMGDAPDNPLKRVLSFDHLDAQLTVGPDEVGLQASLPGTLSIDVGGGNALALTDAFLRVEVGIASAGFAIGGSLDLMLFHRHLAVGGFLSLSTTELTGNLRLEGIELPPAPGLPGVHFIATEEKPLYLSVGVHFAPAGLIMGMKGHFYIQLVDRRVEGDVTFVLEIVEIIPQPLYVEFEIEEMTIPVMLEAMTGAQWAITMADALAHEAAKLPGPLGDGAHDVEGGLHAVEGAISHVNAVLSEVALTDVRIRWCDSIVHLPDGSVAMPGVSFRGHASIFGWDAFAVLDFSSGAMPSLSGHFEAERLNIGGVVEIWGDGKGVRKEPRTADDFNAPVDPTDEGGWYLEPGGPVLHVSTSSSPFLHADLHARLFGFLAADVHAEVTDSGFSFDLHIVEGPAHYDLSCHYWKDEGAFEASGSMGLHLHGALDLGLITLHLDTDLEASVALRVDDTSFELTLHGEFNFQGLRLHLPEVTLTVAFSDIAELAGLIWDKIEELAEDIFEEVLFPIGKFFEDGAKAVADVAVKAAEAVEEVALAAAKEIADIANKAAEGIGKAVDALADAAAEVVQAVKETIDHAAERASEAARPLHDRADALRSQKGNTLEVAANQVAALLLDAGAYVEQAALFVMYLANDAVQWVAARLDEARRWVADRLAQAAALAARLANEAAAFVADVEREVKWLLGEIEKIGHEIEHFFKNLGHSIAHALSSW